MNSRKKIKATLSRLEKKLYQHQHQVSQFEENVQEIIESNQFILVIILCSSLLLGWHFSNRTRSIQQIKHAWHFLFISIISGIKLKLWNVLIHKK